VICRSAARGSLQRAEGRLAQQAIDAKSMTRLVVRTPVLKFASKVGSVGAVASPGGDHDRAQHPAQGRRASIRLTDFELGRRRRQVLEVSPAEQASVTAPAQP